MKIKFWGTRGSIPVPDSRMIRYGGNTTCLEITSGKSVLIIDAGTGIRKLGEDLARRRIYSFSIFLTHSHWDHIQGFPFFQPIYAAKTRVRVFGCTSSYQHLRKILQNQMSYEYFPISFSDLKSQISFVNACTEGYRINDWHITTIRTNHPAFTLGLKIKSPTGSFVFITDNELMHPNPHTPRDEFVRFCHDATYLIHDAQFTDAEYATRKGWGHSTFEQALALARDAGAKNLGFFHHDPNREDDHLSRLEQKFARQGSRNGCTVFAAREMDELVI
jgi:phosphoribosyl 1,2-cyclic phosphodiesterase